MRVLVCGGRDFNNRKAVLEALEPLRKCTRTADPPKSDYYTLEIISGMAPGADTLAAEYARTFGLRLHEFPADWTVHGRAAGPIRNQRMIDEGRPSVVVAFPGGRGTADMVMRARVAGIEVVEVAITPPAQ